MPLPEESRQRVHILVIFDLRTPFHSFVNDDLHCGRSGKVG